ncbi:hypothetical protein KSS87_000459 [Heliosperma pusillum]|nr:hypothetical protein KSS87_000459 [Heliosperma pusillum]
MTFLLKIVSRKQLVRLKNSAKKWMNNDRETPDVSEF